MDMVNSQVHWVNETEVKQSPIGEKSFRSTNSHKGKDAEEDWDKSHRMNPSI